MTGYILRRLIHSLPLLLAISVVAFAIIRSIPGGPMSAYENNPNITDEDIKRLEKAFGLDRPLPEQYLTWLAKFVFGDWGFSYATHLPVLQMIGERLPNTIYLMSVVYVVTLLIAIPIGVFTALRQYSWFDHAVTGTTFAAYSMPTFWLGLLLILLFASLLPKGPQGLPLLPLGGMQTLGMPFDILDRLRHLILPVTALALVGTAHYVRYLRSSMLETIGQDYVRTARAKGLGERVVVGRHALKNAAIPLVTVAALDLPELFVGALVTETIFGWPGMGRLYWDAATRGDYPVIMGILIVAAGLIILANLIADVLYAYLDPRIRYG